MIELLLIEGEGCVSCVSLKQEVSQLPYQVIEPKTQDEAREYVDLYQIEKLPSLTLLLNKEKLGTVSGYQPLFILETWIDALLEKKGETNA